MPVKISLVNPQGQFVGGKVDLDFVPRAAGANAVSVRGMDASQDIDVGAPQRLAAGDYQLTVRSTTGTFAPITQPIHVTDAGGTVTIVVDRGAPIVAPVAPVGPAVTPIGPAVTPVGGPAVTPGGPAQEWLITGLSLHHFRRHLISERAAFRWSVGAAVPGGESCCRLEMR